MPKAQAKADPWLTKGQSQRLKIQQSLPGTVADLMRKTGYSKNSIEHHLAIMRAEHIVAKAYMHRDATAHRKMAVYGEVGNLPKRPVTVKAPKPKPPPPPRRTFVIDSPWRTIWQGRNPFETAY